MPLDDPFAQALAHCDLGARARGGNVEADRTPTVEERVEPGFCEPVADISHVADREPRSIRIRAQHDALEVCGRIRLSLGPQADVSALGADGAPWQIEGRGADGGGDCIQCQTVAAQRFLADLDRDFEVSCAEKVHRRNPWNASEVVAGLIGKALQRRLVHVAPELDLHHLGAEHLAANLRPLDLLREGRDRVDGDLDLIHGAGNVSVRAQHDIDVAVALECPGTHFVDAVDILERFLDSGDDAVFYLLGCGARIRHADLYHPGLDGGHGFLADGVEGKEAGANDQQHEQIRGHRIAREPGDQAALLGKGAHRSAPEMRVRSRSSVTRTGVPATGFEIEVTDTRAPDLRPSAIHTQASSRRAMST